MNGDDDEWRRQRVKTKSDDGGQHELEMDKKEMEKQLLKNGRTPSKSYKDCDMPSLNKVRPN